jgi:hypothetical protein
VAFFDRAQFVILAFVIDPFEKVATSLVAPKRKVVLNRVMSGAVGQR